MNVSVIIPVYNEFGTIRDVIVAVQATGIPTEILAGMMAPPMAPGPAQMDGQGGVAPFCMPTIRAVLVRTGIQNARDVFIIRMPT